MFHERYLLCGCTSVATSWVYRRKTHGIEDGTTAFMEPGEVHRVVAKHKPSHFITLFIERDHFTKLAEEAGGSGVPHFRIPASSSAQLLGDLARLSDFLQWESDPLKLQSQLALVLRQALEFTESRPAALRRSGPALRRSLECARDILEDRMSEPVGLDELAASSALSRFHLVRSFAKQFGLPPHAYQIHVRIKHACRLLRSGMPCAMVASSVGFADQSHFARHFKKIMGVSPSIYAGLPKSLQTSFTQFFS
jgi:AraC-like DNA-binding protein